MTRRPGGFLPLPPLDRRSGEPLQRQITRQIIRAISTGAIEVGERLPSTRALSRVLGISRNTVMAAYEELTALGLLEARRGAGARIAPVAATHAAQLLRRLRAARGPARTVRIEDPDGTSHYLTF